LVAMLSQSVRTIWRTQYRKSASRFHSYCKRRGYTPFYAFKSHLCAHPVAFQPTDLLCREVDTDLLLLLLLLLSRNLRGLRRMSVRARAHSLREWDACNISLASLYSNIMWEPRGGVGGLQYPCREHFSTSSHLPLRQTTTVSRLYQRMLAWAGISVQTSVHKLRK
jgi:hypothetical protein